MIVSQDVQLRSLFDQIRQDQSQHRFMYLKIRDGQHILLTSNRGETPGIKVFFFMTIFRCKLVDVFRDFEHDKGYRCHSYCNERTRDQLEKVDRIDLHDT